MRHLVQSAMGMAACAIVCASDQTASCTKSGNVTTCNVVFAPCISPATTNASGFPASTVYAYVIAPMNGTTWTGNNTGMLTNICNGNTDTSSNSRNSPSPNYLMAMSTAGGQPLGILMSTPGTPFYTAMTNANQRTTGGSLPGISGNSIDAGQKPYWLACLVCGTGAQGGGGSAPLGGPVQNCGQCTAAVSNNPLNFYFTVTGGNLSTAAVATPSGTNNNLGSLGSAQLSDVLRQALVWANAQGWLSPTP